MQAATGRARATPRGGAAVQYPLFDARPYMGKTGSHAEIMRSRSTFAMMEAAAMEAESASP